MPRTYKRKVGSRSYSDYSSEKLDEAVAAVNSGELKLREASRSFNIPYGSLYNHVHKLHSGTSGGQTRLSVAVEQRLVQTIETLGQWKVPVDYIDIRLLVKDYLDRQGICDSRFQNNCPGPDWLCSFMKRHNITKRIADNVTPARAEISLSNVTEYFGELKEALSDIPPQNIINYDETNITDDPGAKRVLCHRGVKRIERKMHHSKTAISLMYSIAADGTFLPPMVVYKAQSCYSEWTQGGPEGTLYDATPSGWFDSRCFHRWFSEILLPYAATLQGPKAVIGDNLAAHFTESVVSAAVDNNIRFICLMPNATHILQPLDVAVFRGMKIEWRKILENWRKESRLKGSIPKNQFPQLLSRLHARMKPENATAGFKATGLYPLDKDSVLKRLPQTNKDNSGNEQVKEKFNEVIAGMLEKHCSPPGTGKVVRKRGKKITPGKPVQLDDLTASTSGVGAAKIPDKTEGAAKVPDTKTTGTKTASVEPSSESEAESQNTSGSEEDEDDESGTNTSTSSHDDAVTMLKQWVVVGYPGKRKNTQLLYMGQITKVIPATDSDDGGSVDVTFLKKLPGTTDPIFKYPETEETDTIPISYIVERVPEPEVNSRHHLVFSGMKNTVVR